MDTKLSRIDDNSVLKKWLEQKITGLNSEIDIRIIHEYEKLQK